MIGKRVYKGVDTGQVKRSGDPTRIGIDQARNDDEDRNGRDDAGHEEKRAHDAFAAQAFTGKDGRQEERNHHFKRNRQNEIADRAKQAGTGRGILEKSQVVCQADETGFFRLNHLEIRKGKTQGSQDRDRFKEQEAQQPREQKKESDRGLIFSEGKVLIRFSILRRGASARLTVNMTDLLEGAHGKCLISLTPLNHAQNPVRHA